MATYDIAALKKGGFMKQKQKGKFSLRLGIVGGQVTAEQLAAVLEVANRYGHGYVHLTARQGIEIPFIDIDQIEEVSPASAARVSARSRHVRAWRHVRTAASTRKVLRRS